MDRNGTKTELSLPELWQIVKRRAPLALAAAFIVGLIYFLIAMRATPTYVAEAQVVIDVTDQQIVASPTPQTALDTALMDTQVEVIASRAIAERVAKALNLYERDEFQPKPPTGVKKVLRTLSDGVSQTLWGNPDPDTLFNEDQRAQRKRTTIINSLMKTVSSRRAGLSYVLSVRVRTNDPVLSAEIANEYAEQYVLNQVENKFETSRMINDWLNSRLGELSQSVEDAEREVQDYRRQANLLSVSGSDLVDRQIERLLNEISDLQRRVTESTAALQIALDSQDSDSLSPVLGSDRIIDLRAEEARILTQREELRTRYGNSHPQTVSVENQLSGVRTEIDSEVRRIIVSLESDLGADQQSLAQAEDQLARLRGQAVSNNRAQVRLAELQRQADAERQIYEQFLARNQELTAISELQQPDAQVLSPAVLPDGPSTPSVRLQLAIAILLGGATAAMVVILWEVFEKRFFTVPDVERFTDLPCLTVIPELNRSRNPITYLDKKPFSSFAESLRRLLTEVDIRNEARPSSYPNLEKGRSKARRGVVVAIIASTEREGKTTTAYGLAVTAQRLLNHRILIIDGDMRRNSLSKTLGIKAEKGLYELLKGDLEPDDVIQTMPDGNFDIIPSRFDQEQNTVVDYASVADTLDRLRARYDLILVDTAPILAVADTRQFVRAADEVVALIRWKSTTRDAVQLLLDTAARLGVNLRGFVLTRRKRIRDNLYTYKDNSRYFVE
ncbi:MAG: polysaccharide biosynthesis tyrosine autokinase [Pseudomonadota bacterium]